MLKEYVQSLLDITLSPKQELLFEMYYNHLVKFNEHTNLTRIVDRKDADIKHFLDSILLSKLLDFNQIETMCDMGAGAGFPSIPLLIVFPNLKVTIVESQIKRINFLNELKVLLNLDFKVVHERAEVYALNNQQSFDLVTARALGELRLILEYGIPMVKVNGYFIAPKGLKYQEEINDAKRALKILSSDIIKIDTFELMNESGFRANILIKKNKHVENFPRAYSTIIKHRL